MVWHPFGVVIDPVEKGSKKVELYGEFEGWKRKHEMGWIMFLLKRWRTAWKEQDRTEQNRGESVFCCLGFFVVKQWLWDVCAEGRENWREKKRIDYFDDWVGCFLAGFCFVTWFCCSCCGNHVCFVFVCGFNFKDELKFCIFVVSIFLKRK